MAIWNIKLSDWGRDKFIKFFDKVYALSFPPEFLEKVNEHFYDDDAVSAQSSLFVHIQSLLQEFGMDDVAVDLETTPELRAELINILNFTTQSKRTQGAIITLPHSTKPTKSIQTSLIKSVSSYNPPFEIDSESETGRTINSMLRSIIDELSFLIPQTGVVFTGEFMIRFDAITQTLISVAPQIEEISIDIENITIETNDDGSVG